MIQFQIPDMSCKHCVNAITEAARRVEADVAVKVDLDTHWVSIDSQGDPTAFALMLTEAGYTPIAVA